MCLSFCENVVKSLPYHNVLVPRSNRIARPAYRPEDDTAVSNDYLDEFLGNQGLNSTNDDLGGQESDNDSDFDPDSSNSKGHSTPKKKVKPNSAQVPPPPPPSLATTINPKTRKVLTSLSFW